ncbi:hypothetical protein ACRAWG_13440 [Methylobacterium sp. P31]
MGKGFTRVVLAALTLGMATAGSAEAQVGPNADVYILGRPGPDRYGYDDDRPRHPPPPPPDDLYDRPRRSPPPLPDDDFDRPRYRYERPRWSDSVCVTARGTCLAPPGPPNAACGCEIPGFGYKRGQIDD